MCSKVEKLVNLIVTAVGINKENFFFSGKLRRNFTSYALRTQIHVALLSPFEESIAHLLCFNLHQNLLIIVSALHATVLCGRSPVMRMANH